VVAEPELDDAEDEQEEERHDEGELDGDRASLTPGATKGPARTPGVDRARLRAWVHRDSLRRQATEK
jgi:hypothetical protein